LKLIQLFSNAAATPHNDKKEKGRKKDGGDGRGPRTTDKK
jgi:hypothetical protein